MTSAQITPQQAQDALNDSLVAVKKSAKKGGLCAKAVRIAVSNSKVQQLFLKKVAGGNIPTGIYCVPSMLFEHVTVVFGFRCPDGIICLIPPSFAAQVDIILEEVTRIDDTYIPRM